MTSERTRNARLLNRRSYLTLTGAAAAGAVAGTGTVGAAADGGAREDGRAPDENLEAMDAVGETTDADLEVVSVPAGEREVVYVSDGETLENVLFDVTACGAGVTIAAYGTNWTVRNVAVHGRVDMGDEAVIGAADTGDGTSRIENVWLGDGAVYEEEGGIGVWVRPDHSGLLEIDRVNVQSMGNNAFYASAPGEGENGIVRFENCYAANCGISHYRVARGIVDNCTAAITDDRQHRRGRGVWAWPAGPVYVRDSHLAMNGYHYSFVPGANGDPSTITALNTQWDDGFHGGWEDQHGGTVYVDQDSGNDPQDVVPEGCPTAAIDAIEP